MGYSYDARGHLCCDACPISDGVRRRPCPFGYCSSRALCKVCYARTKATGEHTKAAHESCRIRSEEYAERERTRVALLASGKAVRCSALNAGTFTEGPYKGFSRVHVLFRSANGTTIGRYTTAAAYSEVPFNVPATPETYECYGPVTLAPSSYQDS